MNWPQPAAPSPRSHGTVFEGSSMDDRLEALTVATGGHLGEDLADARRHPPLRGARPVKTGPSSASTKIEERPVAMRAPIGVERDGSVRRLGEGAP